MRRWNGFGPTARDELSKIVFVCRFFFLWKLISFYRLRNVNQTADTHMQIIQTADAHRTLHYYYLHVRVRWQLAGTSTSITYCALEKCIYSNLVPSYASSITHFVNVKCLTETDSLIKKARKCDAWNIKYPIDCIYFSVFTKWGSKETFTQKER